MTLIVSGMRDSTKRGIYFQPWSPWPNLPSSPLPHVHILPCFVSATVCPEPHTTLTTCSFCKWSIAVGNSWSLVSPTPIWPSSPRPQAYSSVAYVTLKRRCQSYRLSCKKTLVNHEPFFFPQFHFREYLISTSHQKRILACSSVSVCLQYIYTEEALIQQNLLIALFSIAPRRCAPPPKQTRHYVNNLFLIKNTLFF